MLSKWAMPPRYSYRWAYCWSLMTVLAWLIGWGGMALFSSSAVSDRQVWGMLLLAAVLSAVTSITGFLGATAAYLCTCIGYIGGLLEYVMKSADATGWGDLAGFMMFLSIFILSWLIGLVVQLFLRITGKGR